MNKTGDISFLQRIDNKDFARLGSLFLDDWFLLHKKREEVFQVLGSLLI